MRAVAVVILLVVTVWKKFHSQHAGSFADSRKQSKEKLIAYRRSPVSQKIGRDQ
jgi:hypothetical protein